MRDLQLHTHFTVIESVGKGAFSTVYKAKRHHDNAIYALKKVPLADLKQKELENALNEVRILASIKHPNIVGYREAFVDRSVQELCIVMDFVGGGDLSTKIRECKEKKVRFPENLIIKFFYQLTSALYELHIRKIIHRDLKTANVFMTDDLKNVKLGDMNVSKVIKNMFAYTQTGTPYYASPEVWRDEPYNMKADIWSLGCVIYEICMLKPPFNATDMDGLFEKVQKCRAEPFDNFYSKGLRDSISKLLTLNPHNRPSCEKILNFSIFNDLNLILDNKDGQYHDNSDSVFIQNILLDTIHPFADLSQLHKCLPKSQYTDPPKMNDSNKLENVKFNKNKKKEGFKKKKKEELVVEAKQKRGLSNGKTTQIRGNSVNTKSKLIGGLKVADKLLLPYANTKRTADDNNSISTNKNLKKRFILQNKSRLKSVERAITKDKSKVPQRKIESAKDPQMIINNSSKSNNEQYMNNKKIILKHMTKIKQELSKNSDTINKMLHYQKKGSDASKGIKKSIIQLPTIKSSVKQETNSNILSEKMGSNDYSYMNGRNSHFLQANQSLKPFLCNKNSQILSVLKEKFGNKMPKRAMSAAQNKPKESQNIKQRVFSSKEPKHRFECDKVKQFLQKKAANKESKNKNVFINFSVNQNLCVNIPPKNVNKVNVNNLIKHVNKKRTSINSESESYKNVTSKNKSRLL